MTQLNEILNAKKVIIFGASENAKNFLEANNINVKYLVDNDANKWGKTFFNYIVKAPKDLIKEKKEVYIIVASMYYKEIAIQLKKMGFKENLDFCNGVYYLESSKINKNFPVKLINDIKQYTINDYEKIESEVIVFLKSNFKLLSVYNFGSISSPSISDIDLLVCFEEPITKLEVIKQRFRQFVVENNYEYFFCHDPIFLNKEIFKYLPLFHTVSNFNKIYGKELNYEQGNYEYEKTLIWNYFFYKHIWSIRTNSELNCRQSGMLIKNMFHSIKRNSLLSKQDRKEVNLGNIEKKVDEIRNNVLSGVLTVRSFLETVDELWEIIRLQENFEIKQLSEIRSFDIDNFPEKYKKLYSKIIFEKSEYSNSITRALEEMNISYTQARSLFGALPIFDIPYFV